jgi:hypothetical protein
LDDPILHGGMHEGLEGYENWRACLRGVPAKRSEEIPLYSDVSVSDEISQGLGPYRFLNTIATLHLIDQTQCLPVLMLCIDHHLVPSERPLNWERTDDSRFHGGDIADEISALLGLALNIRLKAGSQTRFVDHANGEQRPMSENPATVPRLPYLGHGSILPKRNRLFPQVKIEPRELSRYPSLAPDSATALVRAARLFQNALWICDTSPSDAWLMLVSAVEVAAVHWRQQSSDGPEELFRQLRPEWAKKLDATGGGELVTYFANEWNELLGATNRFIKFILEHLPEPPELRPQIGFVDWGKKAMKATLNKVYEYRSKALHAGIPFPAPLCLPAMLLGEAYEERPSSLAAASGGGVWRAVDLPIRFHTFVHIVRGALLKWWQGMAVETNNA